MDDDIRMTFHLPRPDGIVMDLMPVERQRGETEQVGGRWGVSEFELEGPVWVGLGSWRC